MMITRLPNAAERTTATPCRWPPESVSTAWFTDLIPIFRSARCADDAARIAGMSSRRSTVPKKPFRRISRPRNTLRRDVQRRDHGQVLVDGLDAVRAGVAGVVEGDRFAVHQDLPAVRDQRPGQRLDQGGLAGPVVADHRQHLGRQQVEVGAVDGGHVAVPLDQARGPAAQERSLVPPPGELVQGDRQDHQDAGGDVLVEVVDPGLGQAVAQHADDQRADQGAQHAAAAAEQAGPADDHRGDRLQVRVLVGVRVGIGDAAQRGPGGERGDETGEDVDAHQHPAALDAGQPRRFRAAAHGVHVPAARRSGSARTRRRHTRRASRPRRRWW